MRASEPDTKFLGLTIPTQFDDTLFAAVGGAPLGGLSSNSKRRRG